MLYRYLLINSDERATQELTMEIKFHTKEVETAVNNIRQRAWRIRMAVLATFVLAVIMSCLFYSTIYAYPAFVVVLITGIHLTAEFNVARRFKPAMKWTEVLRQLYVERRYFQEFSPEWRIKIANKEVELLEEKYDAAHEAYRLAQEQALAEKRRIADAEQENRNRRRIAQKAEDTGLGVHFRNQVVHLINADRLDQARELVEQGRSIRELLDRLEATKDDTFIENGYTTLSEEGAQALEGALNRWNQRKELLVQAAKLQEQLQDAAWYQAVIDACESTELDQAKQLIAHAEVCASRLRELTAFETRVQVLPERHAGRRSSLMRQIETLKNDAPSMKPRNYRKSCYDIETEIAEAEEAN